MRQIAITMVLHRVTTGKKYYEVLDVVSNELSRRFDQKDFALVADMETLLLAAANGQQCFTIPESIKCMYKADLNFPRLLTHLQMLSDVIKTNSETTGQVIKKSLISEQFVR